MDNFPKRGMRFVKNQFLSIIRSFLAKLFRPLKNQIKSKELNKLRPKVIANFLGYKLKASSDDHIKINHEAFSILEILENSIGEKESSKNIDLFVQNINLENALRDLRYMKYINKLEI